MKLESKEIESRGRILALSLKIEDCLSRIIYNFFAQRSTDEDTKTIFLKNFILPLSFGQKVNLYKEISNTGRYQGKVMSSLKTVENFPVKNLKEFLQIVKQNLSDIIDTRNYAAHGTEISGAFLTLKEDEVVFMKKFDLLKVSKESMEKFSSLVKDTYTLLSLTDGNLIDKL